MTKSATVKALEATGLIVDEGQRRPEPPADLTREQREEWRAVVNRLPADWFPRETHAMLTAYCRHVCEARRIAGIISAHVKDPGITEAWLKMYDRLLKAQERESRAMQLCATRLRFTNQSSFTRDRTRPEAETEDLPWE